MHDIPLNVADTLYYGSDDGAKTMKRSVKDRPSTQRLHDLIGTWATYLNLAQHEIACANGDRVTIRTPFDLEGHVGLDGNLYWSLALIFQKTMPSYLNTFPAAAATLRGCFRRQERSQSIPADISIVFFAPSLLRNIPWH